MEYFFRNGETSGIHVHTSNFGKGQQKLCQGRNARLGYIFDFLRITNTNSRIQGSIHKLRGELPFPETFHSASRSGWELCETLRLQSAQIRDFPNYEVYL